MGVEEEGSEGAEEMLCHSVPRLPAWQVRSPSARKTLQKNLGQEQVRVHAREDPENKGDAFMLG